MVYLLENNVEILMYHGENDYYYNYIGGLDTINDLGWSGSKNFSESIMENVYTPDGELVAVQKSYKNMKF